jgi:hypothetical protein
MKIRIPSILRRRTTERVAAEEAAIRDVQDIIRRHQAEADLDALAAASTEEIEAGWGHDLDRLSDSVRASLPKRLRKKLDQDSRWQR